MATLANMPLIDPEEKDPLAAYTARESALKIAQVQRVLKQNLGERWKNVLVYIGLFLFLLVVLIIYGISTDNEKYKWVIGHIKAFLVAIILAVVVTVCWLSVKPSKDKTVYGVVPYPQNKPLVPPDSSLCGRSPRTCDPRFPDQNCDAVCLNNEGKSSNNYKCTKPDHPNVYYLGTRLEKDKYYCLPKQASMAIQACSKDFGKVIWTLKPDGTQGWDCQCLYPDLYGGDSCSSPLACKEGMVDNLASGLEKDTNEWGRYKYKFYKDNDPTKPKFFWNSWNSLNPDEIPRDTPKPTSPYEMMQDPRYPGDPNKKIPRFMCYCGGDKEKGIILDGDPFVCHNDICLSGGSFGRAGGSIHGFFDQSTQTCKCAKTNVKTNVNGSCYSPTDLTCKPQLETLICTYQWTFIAQDQRDNGNKITRFLFAAYVKDGRISRSGEKKYLYPNQYNYKGDIEEAFYDVTPIVGVHNLQSKFYDLTSEQEANKNVFFWMYGILSAFPVKENDNVTKDMIDTAYQNMRDANWSHTDLLRVLVKYPGPQGVAMLCNSFYYKRDDEKDCVDKLSKTGSDFYPICDPAIHEFLCIGIKNCIPDFTRNGSKKESEGLGYYCKCPSGLKFNGVACGVCIEDGETVAKPLLGNRKTRSFVNGKEKQTYDCPYCCSGCATVNANFFGGGFGDTTTCGC